MKMKIKILLLVLFALIISACEDELLISEPGNLVPKTVVEDPTLPSITVNSAKLHSEAFGNPDSTMIVVIHGGPGSDYRSLLNCQQLADYGYRVIFYDQRGSGLSQRFSKSFYTSLGKNAVDLMYDDLAAVISYYKRNPSQKVFLIGDSWGGIMATGFAGKYPDAVQGLIVSEPGGFKWSDIMDYVDRSRSFSFFGEAFNDVTYVDQFITGNEDQHEILDYKASMMASDNDITGESNSKPNSFWRAGSVINSALFEVGVKYKPDFRTGVSDFDGSVLFVISEFNKAYQESWAKKISSIYNSVEIFQVMGVGHSGMYPDKNVWAATTLPKFLEYLNSNK